MEKNAWRVCGDVCARINGEPGPCGDMTAYVTQKSGNVQSVHTPAMPAIKLKVYLRAINKIQETI